MSYATEAAKLVRTKVYYLVLTLDTCSRTFGTSPCAATGVQCYNTYYTCKDKTHFNRTTKDYKYTSQQTEVPFKAGELPYIEDIEYLPCEITDTLTVSNRINCTLLDEPWPDVGTDPYVSTRTTKYDGTYWRKWIARNPNYKGRTAKVYQGFLGGAVSDFTEVFVGTLANITYESGAIRIELVDLLKGLDTITVPEEVELELVVDITAASTSLTLSNSTASGLSASGGVLRIEDELIIYTALSSTTHVATGITRGAYGTVAVEHAKDTAIQPCKIYSGNPFDVLEDDMLTTDAGIAAGYIDSTAFTDAKNYPGVEPDVFTIVTEPTSLKTLFFELVELLDCRVWIDEDLKITITHDFPSRPGRTYTELSDSTNIVTNSVSLDYNEASRINKTVLFWDYDYISELDKDSSYGRRVIVNDLEAQGANEYGDTITRKLYCRWLHTGVIDDDIMTVAAANFASRYNTHRRDARKLLTFSLEIKDYALRVGQFAEIETAHVEDQYGMTATGVRYMITCKDKEGDFITLTALQQPTKKLLVIAPDSYSSKTYATATDAEKEYGAFCDANGLMSNGDAGFRIY